MVTRGAANKRKVYDSQDTTPGSYQRDDIVDSDDEDDISVLNFSDESSGEKQKGTTRTTKKVKQLHNNNNNSSNNSNGNKTSTSTTTTTKTTKTSNGSTSKSIIVKNVPNSIDISRKGKRISLDTPKTYNELKQEILSLELIPSKSPLYLCDLSNQLISDEVTYQKFLTTNNNLIIIYTDNERPLETPEEIIVDVTPSKNILLKAGTSDYNFPNAIAEFIDNSIQAVRNNPTGDKFIKITISRPTTQDLSTIKIWDNGSGMNKDDLQKWATMGMSQADQIKIQDNEHTSTTTGLISRFGVGAKKAAFYLGSEIIVITKVKENCLINQAKISLDILNQTGDQEWRIPITVREAYRDEAKHTQFTEVTINNVSLKQDQFEETIESLKKDLSHIYFYYLNPDPSEVSHYSFADTTQDDNNNQSDSEEQQDNKKNKSKKLQLAEQTNISTSPLKSTFVKDYSILLNEFDLSLVRDSLESKYIQLGKKLKKFEFRVDTGCGDASTVICYLRYFPYIQERETLPIPDHMEKEHSAEDLESFPLRLRKPGFEIFWNGRLISEAHIERLAFMSTGTVEGEKIEEKWVQRVKGALFLGSAFPVTHNKMHIIKESPIFARLEKAGTRANSTEWKKWLKKCHKLDQDFQFEVFEYDKDKNKTICKSISYCGETYVVGDPISTKNRAIPHGIIKSMYFSGRPDSRTSEFLFEIDRINYKKNTETDLIPGNKLKCKLKPTEYKKLQDQLTIKLPDRLRLYEGEGVQLPKKEYTAGERIKWVSAVLLDRQQPPKEVDKKITSAEQIQVKLTIIYNIDNEIVFEKEGSDFYQSGKVSFRDINVFKKIGSYTFKFSCSYDNVTPAIHHVKVVPGSASSIRCEWRNPTKITHFGLESELPAICINLLDENNNAIAFTSIPNINFNGSYKDDQQQDNRQATQNLIPIKLKPSQVRLDNAGNLIVTGLTIDKADLGEDSEATIIVGCEVGNIKSTVGPTDEDVVMSTSSTKTSKQQHQQDSQVFKTTLEPIQLLAGPPVAISFTDDPFESPFMNQTCIPPFSLFLKDKSDNICRFIKSLESPQLSSQSGSRRGKSRARKQNNSNQPPTEYLLTSSSVLEEDIILTCDEHGEFSFADSKLLMINENVNKNNNNDSSQQQNNKLGYSIAHIQFSYYKDKVEVFTVEKEIKITPSTKPNFLQLELLPESQMAIQMEDGGYRLLSGSSYNFGVKVFSIGGGGRGPVELSGLSAQITTSWDAKFNETVEMNSSNILTLPPLIADKMTRLIICTVTAKMTWALGTTKQERSIELKKDFKIQTSGGVPSNFVAQFGRGVVSKIRCDSQVTIELKLMDKRGSFVSPSDSKSKIEPYFTLANDISNADDPKQTLQPEPYIQHMEIGEFNKDKLSYPCKLTMVGFGNVVLTAKDKNNTITDFPLKFTMIEGAISMVKVNNLRQLNIQCYKGEFVEEIHVTICDTLGNVVPNVSGIEIICEWINLPPGRSPPFQYKGKTVVNSGIATLSSRNMDIISGSEGEYCLQVQAKNFNISPGIIKFVVKGSASIHLYNQTPLRCVANTNLEPLRVCILNADRKKLAVGKENIRLWLHLKPIDCTSVEEDESVFIFDIGKAYFKAGKYPIRITYSAPGGSNRVEYEENLFVVPDKPHKLFIDATMTKVFNERTMEELITNPVGITITDQYDNKIDTDSSYITNGLVKVFILQSNEPRLQKSRRVICQLLQDYTAHFDANGVATFNRLSLVPSCGSSEIYQLCFEYHQGNQNNNSQNNNLPPLQPFYQKFFYKNQREERDKLVELQGETFQLQQQIKAVEAERKQIDLEVSQLVQKKDQYKSQVNDLIDRLVTMIPNFVERGCANNPPELKKVMGEVTQYFEDLKSRRLRPLSTPQNPVSREMSERSRSQGEEQSGIVGLAMEIMFVEGDAEAKMLSRFLGKKMETVVLLTKEKFEQYYQNYKDSRVNVLFLTLPLLLPFSSKIEEYNRALQTNPDALLPLRPQDGAPTRGFKGFAVNMVQFKERHQKMGIRASLAWVMFRDCMVFDTMANGWDYRNYVISSKRPCPAILCLKELDIIDGSGFISVGRKDSYLDQICFGQLPITESHEYSRLNITKQLLDQFYAIKHECYVFRRTYDNQIMEGGEKSRKLTETLSILNQAVEEKSNEINSQI